MGGRLPKCKMTAKIQYGFQNHDGYQQFKLAATIQDDREQFKMAATLKKIHSARSLAQISV